MRWVAGDADLPRLPPDRWLVVIATPHEAREMSDRLRPTLSLNGEPTVLHAAEHPALGRELLVGSLFVSRSSPAWAETRQGLGRASAE